MAVKSDKDDRYGLASLNTHGGLFKVHTACAGTSVASAHNGIL